MDRKTSGRYEHNAPDNRLVLLWTDADDAEPEMTALAAD